MGMVSFLMADAALAAGVTIRTGIPVGEIIPGDGVVLECGTRIGAGVVVCNADPRKALGMLGSHADSSWSARVRGVPIEGCTVKLNVALREMPNFLARPGTFETHHKGDQHPSHA